MAGVADQIQKYAGAGQQGVQPMQGGILAGNTPVKPAFERGMVVQCRSLIVDQNGVAWWVLPEAMVIRKAEHIVT